MFKHSVIAVAIAGVLSGCATPMLTSSQMKNKVADRTSEAVSNFQKSTDTAARVKIVEPSPVDDYVKTEEPMLKGDITMKSASAPIGPVLMELAKKEDYSVVFSDNIDVYRKVSLNLNQAFTEEAIRTVAYLAGYAAVFDKDRKIVYISETANFVFKLPSNIFSKLDAEYSFGGDASSAGGSSGGSSSSGGGSSGSSSSLKTEFKITGTTSAEGDGLASFLKTMGGSGVEVSTTKGGLINVKGSAQGIYRIHSFLKKYYQAARSQVVIESSIVEVGLTNSFEFGIQWGRVMDAASKGAFIGGSSALATAAVAAGTGGSTSSLITQASQMAATNSANGGLGIYRVTANSSTIIKALGQFTDVNVVSQPTLWAMNNTPATFFDGSRVPYLASLEQTQATTTGGSPTETGTVDFAINGISFSVIPSIMDKKSVEITLTPVLSQTGAMSSFLNDKMKVPTQGSKNSFMRVVAESGKTMILGGLKTSEDSKDTTVASSTGRTNSTKEIVILLKATILPAPSNADPLFMESI